MKSAVQLRRFGLLSGAALVLLGAVALWRGAFAPASVLAGVGAVLWSFALVAPSRLGVVKRASIALAARLAIVLTSVILMLTLIEIVSWAVLRIGFVSPDMNAQLLMDAFPAVFRLERPLRIQAARGSSGPRSGLGFDTFEFDPALGYRNVGYLRWFTTARASRPATYEELDEWWDSFASAAKGRLVIVCLGGSTTASAQATNWPRYVADLLSLHGVEKPAIVLNAGHNGFMTMQEQIWASYWIFPELDRRGVRVDVALTLDGVNDISTGLGGWQAHHRYSNSPWLKSYNGFHQYLDAYSRSREQPGPALAAWWSAVQRSAFVNSIRDHAAALLPTTMGLARRLGRDRRFEPAGEFLLAWRRHNVFRIHDQVVGVPWEAGSVVLSDMPALPTAKVARSVSAVLALIETAGSNGARAPDAAVDAPSRDNRKWGTLPDLPITAADQWELVDAYRSNLLTTQSVFLGRGIPVVSALQPIADPDDNPMVSRARGKDIPNFDYVLVHWAMAGTQPGTFMRMPGRATYRMAKEMYARLAAEFPSRFVDLTGLFADGAEDYFVGDNIHYTASGSLRIARAMVEACLAARACGQAKAVSLPREAVLPLADVTRLANDTTPQVVSTRGGYNIVRFAGKYWAVPHAAGQIDWERQDIDRVPGVYGGFTLADVHTWLAH